MASNKQPPRVVTRVSTGISGLDTVLGGGLLERGLYILQGLPGTGKTILANQIGFHRAAQGDRVIFFTLLAEPHDRMLEHLQGMSFTDVRLLPDPLSYVSAFGALEQDGLPGLLQLVRETLRKKKPKLLVLDGLYVAHEYVGGARDLRKLIYELQGEAVANDCIMLFLANGPLADIAPEHTMVDGLIELTDELVEARAVRMLRIQKLRGGAQQRGQHVFHITDDGIVVWPRLEATVRETAPRAKPGTIKIGTGIPDLDSMLEGGLPEGSTSLVVGPSGSGKTTTGLLFLGQSTPEEPGVLLGCYEAPEELYLKAASVGVDLEGLVRRGAVRLLRYLPFESCLDEMGQGLLAAVREAKGRRVFIDGIGAFEQTAIYPSRLQPFFTALSLALRAEGATVVCTAESKELFSPSDLVLARISPVAENMLLLRLAEHESKLTRLLSVIKVRQSGFDPAIRPFEIYDGGIRVLPPIDRVEDVIRGSRHRAASGLAP
jgi:circadian clock protein KaiC